MSKYHGLRIVHPENLLVDVSSLLAYFHLIIAGYHECLYCGTQRSTRQAAQQHMMGKGHCKYDITDEDSELRDFYKPSNAQMERDSAMATMRTANSPKPRKLKAARSPHSAGRQDSVRAAVSTSSSESDSEQQLGATEASSQTQALSTRARKQESVLTNQLSHLRANDRRSLLHLPAAQQRALLLTHHQQLEKARRTEQTQRGHLESAANISGRLDTVRLKRVPPHFGQVSGLNR
jgi:pre-60S factor REI1